MNECGITRERKNRLLDEFGMGDIPAQPSRRETMGRAFAGEHERRERKAVIRIPANKSGQTDRLRREIAEATSQHGSVLEVHYRGQAFSMMLDD
jgi:hypothetical protein